jgi:hypothetical protein
MRCGERPTMGDALQIVAVIVALTVGTTLSLAFVKVYPVWRGLKGPLVARRCDLRSRAATKAAGRSRLLLRLHSYGDASAVGWQFILITDGQPWTKWVSRSDDSDTNNDPMATPP